VRNRILDDSLAKVYLDAELGFPTIVADVLVGGGRGSSLYQWVANTFVSISPRFADLGLSLPTGVVPDSSLAARLQEAVVRACSQVMGVTQFGVWARKPVAEELQGDPLSPPRLAE
jgi:hypothetical protein